MDDPTPPGQDGSESSGPESADVGDDQRWHAETRAIRAGRRDNDRALAPILWATSTFVTPTVEEGRQLATGGGSRFYSRYGNPTVQAFEEAVADLEGAEAARAFASGMGAVAAVVLGLCSQGDHIVSQRQLYAGTQMLLQAICPRFGIDVTLVDATEPGAFAAAVEPGRTVLVLVETPANPRLDLVDLEEIGAIAGPVTAVDSTFATPLAQRPLDHGADLVIHSATKALAGHNDATIGVVAGSEELVTWLWQFAVLQGACASPFDALNALRGLRTLGVRLQRQSETASALAAWMEGRDGVAAVRHPGLASHPQPELAARLALPGGLVTIDLDGGLEAGVAFVEALELAQLATSLGGPETLVTHPASTTHVNLTPEELDAAGIQPGTVRMSVGLEHLEDLRSDLERALRAAVAAGGAAGEGAAGA